MNRRLAIVALLAVFGLTMSYRKLPPLARRWLSERLGGDAEVPVRIVRATKMPLGRTIDLDGELQPSREADIIAQLPGVVKEIRYRIGERVPAGAVVATIESKELAARLRASEAAVKEAEVNWRQKETRVASAESAVATARELYRKELIARRDVDEALAAASTARAEEEVAQAQLAQRQAALAQTRYLLELTRITAPFDGVLTRRWLEPGAPVSSSTTILSIANADTMRLVVRLAPEDTALVRPGMTVGFRLADLPAQVFEGKLARIDTASESGDSPMVEIHVSNQDRRLKPGMKAVLSLPVAQARGAFLLPKAAVFELQGQSYVYTIVAGRAERRAVATGAEQDGKIVISSGLEEGESVILTGSDKIEPGSRVYDAEQAHAR